MRTLAIAPVLPEPLDGGAAIRTRHILRALGAIGDVTLVAWEPRSRPLQDIAEVITLPHRDLGRQDPRDLVRALAPPTTAPVPGRLAYVGALDWWPNELALKEFLLTT